MNILITHGYLLTGTGSNLYVNNVARELCKAGHNVYLVCQDYEPENIDYIQDVYVFKEDNTQHNKILHKETLYSGKCLCFKPNLNHFLPVYVFDHYKGFIVKEFPNCTDDEIKNYINQNLTALQTILKAYSIDIIQTNHTIMFPYVVSCIPDLERYKHFITLHGSALNFSVKKDKRFIFHAQKGFESAEKIFVVSNHAREELIEFCKSNTMHGIIDKIHRIPAGVDIDNFKILQSSKKSLVQLFEQKVTSGLDCSRGRKQEQTEKMLNDVPETEGDIIALIKSVQSQYDYRYADCTISEKIKSVDFENEKIIMFVGKYLWTKGIYLILLAAPLILEKYPDTRFIFIGFGPFRETAEFIINCLSHNRLDVLEKLLKGKSRVFCHDDRNVFPFLAENFEINKIHLKKALKTVGNNLKEKVIFTGILEHAYLKYLLPCADILIAPSVFPESFGMVGVEAMSCGVYPIVTYQSAFREVTDMLRENIKDYNLEVRNVLLDEDAIIHLYKNVEAYFQLQEKLQLENRLHQFKESLRSIAVNHYSWQAIAQRYINFYNL